jgi:uncharacterized membrane protein/protein-disulfide isomerase
VAARTRHTDIEGITSPGLVFAVRLLILAALAISAYLASVSLGGGLPIGCGPQSDCDKVLGSKWGYWFGVPVSVFAIVVDLLILISTLALKPKAPAVAQRRAWAVAVPCALLVIGGAIWFVAVQVFAIGAICPYCMVAHGCGLVAGTLLLIAAPIRQVPERLWDLDQQVFVTTRRFKRSALLALLALTILIAGQIVHEPKTGLVTTIVTATNAVPLNAVSLSNAAAVSPVATQTLAPTVLTNKVSSNAPPPHVSASPLVAPATNSPVAGPRLLQVYNGKFQLNLDEVPRIGSSTKPYALVSLFDYTCHHCREMHSRLVEAQRVLSNQLVVVNLPMPLDPGCNPTMSRPHPLHTNACEYARLGLAVWRADRTKHAEFEDWLFAPERPPPLAEAKALAARLVGAERFENAAKDSWIEQQLKQDVAIYELAYRAGQGSMPQLIFPTKVAVGTFLQDDLYRLIEEGFGFKRTP